jgi:HD domain
MSADAAPEVAARGSHASSGCQHQRGPASPNSWPRSRSELTSASVSRWNTCFVSARFRFRLAELRGMSDEDRLVVYYTALLVNVGCHSDAHEQAKWFGDDITLKSSKYTHNMRSVRGAAASMRLIGAGNPPLHRFRVGLEFAMRGHHDLDTMIRTHSEIAQSLARQLKLDDVVCEAVGASYERWDGKGWPGELAGEQIPLAARLTQLAEYVEVAHRVGGTGAALALARKRRGSQFDPELTTFFCAHADELLSNLDGTRTWQMVVDAEPALGMRLVGDDIDEALLAIADFVDLKSPYTLGACPGGRRARDGGCDAAWHGRRREPGSRSGGARPLSRTARCVELDLGQAGAARDG